MADNTAIRLYKDVAVQFKPALLANENAYLEDVYTTQDINSEPPLVSGLFRLEPGTPLVYTYTYNEMKYVVSGEFIITDSTGKTVTAVAGDHLFFPKGASVTFTTEKGGVGFYVGQRKKGDA